jgi:signal transduction histidine kinase
MTTASQRSSSGGDTEGQDGAGVGASGVAGSRRAAVPTAPVAEVPGQGGKPWLARWWERRGLRARLALTATAGLGLALCVGAWFAVHALAGSLTAALDGTARQGAEGVAALIDANRLPDPVPVAGGTVTVQVLGADGGIRAASPGADRLVPLLSGPELSSAERSGKAVTLEGGPYAVPGPMRVVAVRADGGQIVIAGVSFTQVRTSITTLFHSALIGTPLLIIFLAGVNWLVIGGALRPIAGLRRGAQEISETVGPRRLPIPDTRDEVHSLAVTLNDMLTRLQASEARQRELVSDTAHELRSPIASIRTQLEVALDHPEGVDWHETAAGVLTDTLRLARLAEDMLVLAHLDEQACRPALRREPVDLEAITHGTIGRYANARVPVTMDASGTDDNGDPPGGAAGGGAGGGAGSGSPGDPSHEAGGGGAGDTAACIPVLGDTVGMTRLVSNLVDNGVRYARSQVMVGVRRDDGHALLTVTDDGPGIPAADKQRVFDRFTRLDDGRTREESETGGAGLGLAIVRATVHAHGGEVWLEDAAPGLRAVVRLPVDRPPAG